MKKIKIFLASSNELKPERTLFEIEIYRKCKAWFDKEIFLQLDIWEDLSARMSQQNSQEEYNKFVRSADLFVLLVYTKFGIYSGEEFENAFGTFKSTQKPFIFTYFKETDHPVDNSLLQFKQKLKDLGHFYSPFTDSNDLWNQFNKELERLQLDKFEKHPETSAGNTIAGDHNILIQGSAGNQITINTGKTTNQTAEKIFNINKIDKADFS